MHVRLAFSSSTALEGSGRVATTSSFLIERDTGWHHLTFDLSPAAITPLAGSNVVEVMSSVSEARIISADQPAFIGDQFIARLGVDNITAITVPEPDASMLMGLSILLIAIPSRENPNGNRGFLKRSQRLFRACGQAIC